MLRMMCKECVKADRNYYFERRKTGKVEKTEKVEGRTRKTVICTVCGHGWHYFGKKR